MAAINVALNGVIVDLYGRVISGPVKILGQLMYSDRGVGGGPMPPGPGGGGDPPGIWGGPIDPYPDHGLPGQPPGIWGGPIDPYPDHGLPGKPPGIWGPNDPRPNPPIAFPPGWVGGVPPLPPGVTPPEPPAPGSPTTVVPGNWPTTGIVPPSYMIVQYPGIGPVVVAPPVAPAQPG